MVEIGRNCVIVRGRRTVPALTSQGRFAIIKDCAKIEDDTVIAPGTVVPSHAVFSGSPGQQTDELPESAQEAIEGRARSRYSRFVAA